MLEGLTFARRAVRLLGAASLLSLGTAQAWAQEQVPVTPTTADAVPPREAAAGGDEIVVTAQRREERLQDVPVSILAFSAAKLEQANIEDLADLPRISPGLAISTSVRTASVRTIIRGIGTAGSAAVEPSVAIFTDGFYVPRPGAALSTFLDLANVQVLRGPQGTLFGRNASAGAISTVSAVPTNNLGGQLALEYGTGGRYRLDGHVNLPVSDSVKLRIAGVGELFDGLYHNLQDGRNVGGNDSYAARGTAEFRLSPDIKTTVRIDYSSITGDGFSPYQWIGGSFAPGTQGPFEARVAAAGGTIGDLNPYDRIVNQFVNSYISDHQVGASNTFEAGFGNGFTVKLLSGYRRWKNAQRGDTPVGFTFRTLENDTTIESKSFSNELQIASPQDLLLGGKLSFVAGLYQYREKFATSNQIVLFAQFCPLLFPATSPNRAICIAGSGSPVNRELFDQTTNSYAVYAQATYKFLPTLDLVLGGRITRDDKEARYNSVLFSPVGALNAGPPEQTALGVTQTQPTWRVNLNWRPTEDILLFASASTGYKSAGFNSLASRAIVGQARRFAEETTENYELGARTSWLDNRFILNATLYRMDVKGFQDRSIQGTDFIVKNAGDIRQQGFELEATARPTRQISLNFGVAYLDSNFTSYREASNLPGVPGSQNLTGTRNNFSPKWQGTLGAQYVGKFGDSGWGFAARSDLAFVSSANVGQAINNDPRTVQPAFQQLSARLSILSPDERYTLAFFGENLNGAKYCSAIGTQFYGANLGLVVPPIAALRCAAAGAPRTLGVRLTTRF